MTAPLVEARNLSAGYTRQPAVWDLDLVVAPGEIVALMGGNGAGKTLVLRTLAGLLRPIDGDVLWKGKATREALHRRARNGLALVTETRSIFRGLSVRENLRLGRGDPARVTEIFPELKPLLRRRAELLSGGEQQMLSLGRVLAGNPQLLLADELSLGLAPVVVKRLLGALLEARNEGTGILLVEQHVGLALSVADRAYVLQRGRVVLEGDAADLRGRVSELRHTYLPQSAGDEAD